MTTPPLEIHPHKPNEAEVIALAVEAAANTMKAVIKAYFGPNADHADLVDDEIALLFTVARGLFDGTFRN